MKQNNWFATVLCSRPVMFYPEGINPGKSQAGLSLLSLLLILLNRAKPNPDLSRSTLTFLPYRHDNPLLKVFPIKGKALKYVTLSAEDDWLLVKLSSAFIHEGHNTEHVLIKRGDKQPIVPNRLNQLVHFKMVPDIKMIKEQGNDIGSFPMEVWALCK